MKLYLKVFENASSKMTSRIQILFTLLMIMLKLSAVIHLISSIWIYNSNYVTQLYTNYFLKFLSDGSLMEFGEVLNIIREKQFYLITQTLTVVGYGDSKSLPN